MKVVDMVKKMRMRWLRSSLVRIFSSMAHFREPKSLTPLVTSKFGPSDGPSQFLIQDEEELTTWFQTNRTCPDCGGSEFISGPRAGVSQNIRCAELTCSSQYNTVELQGHYLFAQRIHWGDFSRP
jgi:hypothetical protein